MITLVLAYEYNNDSISAVNVLGFLLCIAGIVLHVWIKVGDVSGESNSCNSLLTSVLILASEDRSFADMDVAEAQQLIAESQMDYDDDRVEVSKELKDVDQHQC